MRHVTDSDEPVPAEGVERVQAGSLVLAAVVGVGLAVAARTNALALLIAVAVTQALLAAGWVFCSRMPGRKGALVLAALAAAGADVSVSIWPHGKLGTLLAVLGLAVPLLFIHQLMRGAARSRIVQSLSGIALLVLAEVALAALLQLRHEFGGQTGGQVVAGVVAAAAGALVVGYLVDLIAPLPRFDPDVPRGLLGVVASAGLGGSLGYLLLQSDRLGTFASGRGAFIGASLGALVGLLAVAVAFAERELPVRADGAGQRWRPFVGVLVPISVLAPVAFLLCLAIRT
jgi:hypothetical protein